MLECAVSKSGSVEIADPAANKTALLSDVAMEPISASPAMSPIQDAALEPPSGGLLVDVLLDGQELVSSYAVQVLPGDTFCGLCTAALRGAAPDTAQGMWCTQQAFMLVGSTDVEIQNPDSAAASTLSSFPGVRRLRFVVGPAGAGTATATRGPVVRLGRRRKHPRAVRIIAGIAKFVLAVEAAALLRGTLFTMARHVRRALPGGRGAADDSGSSMGTETEQVYEDVANYVTGRGGLSKLQRHDPGRVVGALEEMDTHVLEELEVSDVPETRKAVLELLQQLQRQPEAGGDQAAEASGSGLAAPDEADAPRPGFGPVADAARSKGGDQ